MAGTTSYKFTTTTTGPTNQRPTAVLAVQRIDALLGSIIQLDGRQSFDPEGQALTWSWRFVQVPIGSEVESSGFSSLRPGDSAVSFTPDKTGLYVVELIVNDGELDSAPTTATVNIQLSRVPCGEGIIPDAHFLWSHLSNFWNLVEDREKITTIWSSVIQLVGTELIKLWSADNNKSLATIQNSYQRRWQGFEATTSLLEEFEQRIITGKTDSGTGAATGTLGVLPEVGNTKVISVPLGSRGDITKADFTTLEGNYGAKGRVIVVNEEAYTISRVTNENALWRSFVDGVVSVGTNTFTSASVLFITNELQPGDGVTILDGDDAGSYIIENIVAEDEVTLLNTDGSTPVFSSVTVDSFSVSRNFTVAVVDEEAIPDGQAGVPWRIPNLLHVPTVNFEDVGVRAGDVLVFDVTRKDLGLTAELRAQVVGVDRTRLGFDFTLEDLEDGVENIDREALKQLVLDLKIVPPEAPETEVIAAAETLVAFMPTSINLGTRPFSTFRIVLKANRIIHNSVLVGDGDLINAPALQETIQEPPVVLRENLDYIIENGNIIFTSGLFTVKEPAPDLLWAECAVFDNADTIENNFGRLVNLSQDDLTAKRTRAPYLSAVKGLFFAYTNGPTVANIRLGLQILLGLPFTEEKGVILEEQDNFTTDSSGNPLGRVLMEDIDDENNRTGFRRVYFYPSVVGLEDNPTTGQPFVVGDVVEQFTPLSKGAEVEDYINVPDWWIRSLQGIEVLKYFTFKVTIDGEIFDFNDVIFAFDFVKAIKPAYTHVIATTLLKLEDDIDVEEVYGGNIAAQFYDNNWGLEATRRLNDQNQQGVVLFNAGSRPLHTRVTRMFRDLVTYESGGAVYAASAAGWDASLLRSENNGGVLPAQEADILVIHKGQQGAFLTAPGLYHIASVIDGNTLRLQSEAPAYDPETYVADPLDPNLFTYGTDLTGSIVRRMLNPLVMGNDLETIAGDNLVTSASAEFLDNAVGPGDHLIIELGDNQNEYLIEAVTPFVVGPPQVPPLITAAQVRLLNLDGTVPTLQPLTNQYFRVIRPDLQSRTHPGGVVALGPYAGALKGGFSFFTGSRIELDVFDPVGGYAIDVFTPGMVGTYVSVSNSENPANDGTFLILGYLGPSKVVVDSSSVVSDASRQATVTLV